MEQQYIDWIEDHMVIFRGNARTDQYTREQVYSIYNAVFNENRQPSGCGRCWANVKGKLYEKYLQSI